MIFIYAGPLSKYYNHRSGFGNSNMKLISKTILNLADIYVVKLGKESQTQSCISIIHIPRTSELEIFISGLNFNMFIL